MRRTLVVLITVASLLVAQKKPRELKPGFNLFSVQQDVQIGKEGSAEIEKQVAVVRNDQLTGYVNRVGERLAKSKHAGKWPYSFKVVHDKTINAFALPGGPMYVHTGLISSAENEAQLAGVLAHEMSHVNLRHGTNQVSKANLIQIPAMLAGAMLGNDSLVGMLGQLGISVAAGSTLLKYSRDAERDADLNGARMMADVGYNPIEMARFFEKLEAKGQKDNFLTRFLSDHPSPGNRVKYVEDDIRLFPQRSYDPPETQQFRQMQQVVSNLPPPPARPQAQGGNVPQASRTPDIRPSSRFREYSGKSFMISHPDNWEAFGDQQSGTVTIAPREAFVRDAQGRTNVGYGAIVSHYFPPGDRIDVRRDTDALIRQLSQNNPGMRRSNEAQRNVQAGGANGLLTTLESPSPYPNETEIIVLLTVPRPEGLFYTAFIAPRSQYKGVERTFEEMLRSVRFAN